MEEIILDASGWKDISDFYDSVLAALGAPDWHGRNLDALNDSIGGNDINLAKLPYSFYVIGYGSIPEELSEYLDRFIELIMDLRESGVDVDIHIDES